jgi:ribosomal protein L12E/L44/L45/RPP1/RPP2
LYVQRGDKYELSVELGDGVGVKSFTDFAKLNTALGKERNDHKTTKALLAKLGDRNIDEVVAQLDRIPELEAAAGGKLDDKRVGELVEGKLNAKLAPVQRELQTAKAQLAERDQLIQGYVTKERTRTIHDAVRGAIGKAQGFQPSAVEDALMYAERMFEVDEQGNVVTKDNVGVTPGIAADVWLSEMQAKKNHWWGPTAGGGAGGNTGKGGQLSGNNPWTAANWNMTEQGKLYRADPKKAEQMARSAGTTIGGRKPAAK